MRMLRRLAWFIVLALVLLGFSLLVGHFFFTADAAEPDIDATIRYWARYYSLDEEFLVCIARAESGFDRAALGKNGEVGLFQFRAESWILVREAMGLPTWTWLRLDAEENARTAAYAIGIMDLARWWTTTGGCR